jgi:hypothetical protein
VKSLRGQTEQLKFLPLRLLTGEPSVLTPREATIPCEIPSGPDVRSIATPPQDLATAASPTSATTAKTRCAHKKSPASPASLRTTGPSVPTQERATPFPQELPPTHSEGLVTTKPVSLNPTSSSSNGTRPAPYASKLVRVSPSTTSIKEAEASQLFSLAMANIQSRSLHTLLVRPVLHLCSCIRSSVRGCGNTSNELSLTVLKDEGVHIQLKSAMRMIRQLT